ncbi:copine family protein [Stylonychia lemnae]|uniref:Copine family protein n=1 Tax=Stylonychia lemnae TaxID=5949 RepID=A0A078APL6_STYLE|nr:copine family protein [Stylonychia lemnae]|eukprot:CDW84094.1 copine family protein [Stylonychia lemnae]
MQNYELRQRSGEILDETIITYKVQLFIQCRNLRDEDNETMCNPQCCLSWKPDNIEQVWQLLDKTDAKINESNPQFEKPFQLDFQFDKIQPLKFTIQDKLGEYKYENLCSFETTLGAILGSKNQILTKDLKIEGVKNSRSCISIRAESIKDANWDLTLKLAGKNLPHNTSCIVFPNNQVFLEIYKGSKIDSKQKTKVYHSDIALGTNSPVYQPFKLSGKQLCDSDRTMPIHFIFKNRVGLDDKLVGSCCLTLQEIIQRKEFQLKNTQTNALAGELHIHQFILVDQPSFVEYLRGGWQITFQLGIDFTDSNGDAKDYDSLHSIKEFNQYEQIMTQIGKILEAFDQEKLFPVFGFGAAPLFQGTREEVDIFPLNGNTVNPEIFGIEGILEYYRQNLNGIKQGEHTKIANLLNTMIDLAKVKVQQQIYHVLLILIDSNIEDIQIVKDLIVLTSSLPISLVFIGVGYDSFKAMKQLDSKEAIIKDYKGSYPARENSIFIKSQKFLGQAPGLFAERALREIPNHFLNYMMYKGIKPSVFGS